jgi:hypothetical protein
MLYFPRSSLLRPETTRQTVCYRRKRTLKVKSLKLEISTLRAEFLIYHSARRKREAFDKAFNELTSTYIHAKIAYSDAKFLSSLSGPGGVNMLIRRSGSVESFQTVIGQSEKIGEGLVPNHLETDSDKEHWHVNLYAEKTS